MEAIKLSSIFDVSLGKYILKPLQLASATNADRPNTPFPQTPIRFLSISSKTYAYSRALIAAHAQTAILPAEDFLRLVGEIKAEIPDLKLPLFSLIFR